MELKLNNLLEQYRYYLFDDYIPFMEKYVIDHEYGGFMCNTDRDGTNITKNKNIWFEGRGIWVYSFLYNKFGKEPKFLETARKSVRFIMKHEPKGEAMFPSGFTREGEPAGNTGLATLWRDPGWDMYGDLFVANGLAEFSKATGNDLYRKKAKDILLKCIRIYDCADYPYEVTYGPDVPHSRGLRILGHWMVFLHLATQMLEHRPDVEIEKIAGRCVDAIMNYHYNPEYGLLNEVLNHDMNRPDNGYSQFVYTGHAIETLWMVMAEAIRLNDNDLFDLAVRRFRRHIEAAWDDVYEGVFRGLDNVDQNTWKLDKVLWAQEEALVGTLMVVERTGAQWAKDLFAKIYSYVIENYPMKKYGYSLWINDADRKVTFKEHATRVENYHHPRHIMLNILCLEGMIKKSTG